MEFMKDTLQRKMAAPIKFRRATIKELVFEVDEIAMPEPEPWPSVCGVLWRYRRHDNASDGTST